MTNERFIANVKSFIDADFEKWLWMMDYCEQNKLPPADDNVWKKAEQEYLKSKDDSV